MGRFRGYPSIARTVLIASAGDIGRAHISRFIGGILLVSDYLEEGLYQFDQHVEDYLDNH